MVENLADRPNEDVTLVVMPDDKQASQPDAATAKEDAASESTVGPQECEYCGHKPCGCGG